MSHLFSLLVGIMMGLITAFVPFKINERKIAAEYIIKQRQVWRDKVRKVSQEIIEVRGTDCSHTLLSLYGEFAMLLNPIDLEDKGILDIIWDIKGDHSNTKLKVELVERVTLLLKHDWERAKKEAGLGSSREKIRRIKYFRFKFKRFGIK